MASITALQPSEKSLKSLDSLEAEVNEPILCSTKSLSESDAVWAVMASASCTLMEAMILLPIWAFIMEIFFSWYP